MHLTFSFYLLFRLVSSRLVSLRFLIQMKNVGGIGDRFDVNRPVNVILYTSQEIITWGGRVDYEPTWPKIVKPLIQPDYGGTNQLPNESCHWYNKQCRYWKPNSRR